MNLKKNIEVSSYLVLAKYKVKKENTPMLSILKAVSELIRDEGYTNAEMLCEHLLHPLSEQATENLLLRLKGMNYLREYDPLEEDIHERDYWEDEFYDDDKGYLLTKLGKDAVQNEAYYEERKGVLKIKLAKTDDFVLQRIISIEESGKNIQEDKQANIKVEQLPFFIKNLPKLEEIYTLNDGEYTLDKIEYKGIIGKPQDERLEVTVDGSGAIAKTLNYEKNLSFWTVALVEKELLRNKFNQNYIEQDNLVKVPYDKNKIMFSRKETIQEPIVGSTTFESLDLNIKVSPRNITEAKLWYLELLSQKILNRAYFLSEDEFQNYANDLAKEFILFEEELMNQFSRSTLLDVFEEEKDFYIRAKLETIDYLNY